MRTRQIATTPTEACCSSVVDASLTDAAAGDLAQAFAALADPSRLRILNLLAAAPDGEVCICNLVEPIGKSQPTISHHMRILGDAGLVRGERRGKWVWYALDRERLSQIRGALDS